MKTRAQIYSHEASGILRDISTYGVLTQKQIFGLYPQKDEQIKNLLTYLCKQKRLFLVDGFYSLTPELPKDRDRGLEAAVTVLADFMEQVEYHAAGEYPVKIIFLADGEVYEILYAEPGKEAILNLLLARPEQEPPVRLVILEDAAQVDLLAIPNVRAYCLLDSYRDTDVAAISLEDMKQLLRSGIGELYDYTYEDETREIEETVLNEDGEEVTELREVTVRVYTLTYRGEAYFADSIFHLTAEQKTLAQNFAENLSLFLGDGLFQNLSSSESGFTIPALGDIRYTDGSTEVVYYNQLDERYANKPYGTDDIGGYGCGPTAMAMVVSSLTDDLVDPVEMAKWSYEHGYWCSGSGSYHALIPAAAEAWGLPVSGCTASEPQRITDALSSGKLIVAIMSAGHFTSSGHFIVLRGVKDEKILVADPASRTRSEQGWELSIILNEASKAAGSGGPFWIIG